MWALYQYDAYQSLDGQDLRLFWALLDRLPYEPRSVWRAEQAGGMSHFGWTTESYLLATVGDLIQVNTNVTAAHGSKKKPKRITPLERPETATAAKPETLDAVPWGFFR